MSESELTPAEEAILAHIYKYGHDIPANIAERAGFHRNSVTRSAKKLTDKGLIENKGRGVYKLTEAGRDEARKLQENA